MCFTVFLLLGGGYVLGGSGRKLFTATRHPQTQPLLHFLLCETTKVSLFKLRCIQLGFLTLV